MLNRFNAVQSGWNIHNKFRFVSIVCVAALCVLIAVLFNNEKNPGAVKTKLIHNSTDTKAVVENFSGYKIKLKGPDYNLIFNKGVKSSSASCIITAEKPLSSQTDILKYFKFNPLSNLCIPENYNGCFYKSADDNMYCSRAYFNNKNLLWLTCNYVQNTEKYDTGIITIALSNGAPRTFDIEPEGKTENSQIYGTEVTLIHESGKPYDSFSAKFKYKNIGICVFAENGVTEAEFLNTLFSIVRE